MKWQWTTRLVSGLTGLEKEENVHSVSLCFQDEKMEEHYRIYQFELSKENLNGRWGAFSLTSMITLASLLLFYLETLHGLFENVTSGTVERIILAAPFTAFCAHHQFMVHTKSCRGIVDIRTSKQFVIQYVLFFTFTDMMVVYVNDTFPMYEGCPKYRFRCPFTFSSPHLAARDLTVCNLVIFHLTPCVSFPCVAQLSGMLIGFSRVLGFLLYHEQMGESIWSTSCVGLLSCIFLWCRYTHELNNRKKFLLQLQTSQLRSRMRAVVASMMPAHVLERARAGGPVAETYENVAVLFCSISTPAEADALKSFLLVADLHDAFEHLVRGSQPRPFKVRLMANADATMVRSVR